MFEKQSNSIKVMPRGGKRKGAGRKAGIPNRFSVKTREALWEYIESQTTGTQEANPFKRLVCRMLQTSDEHIEVSCAKELADRLLPKLKAVEHSGVIRTGEERRQRIDELLAKRNGHAVES